MRTLCGQPYTHFNKVTDEVEYLRTLAGRLRKKIVAFRGPDGAAIHDKKVICGFMLSSSSSLHTSVWMKLMNNVQIEFSGIGASSPRTSQEVAPSV